jgi:hypothetical protein
MTLAPLVSRRGPAADVDRQDRGSILIEDHSVTANAEAVAVSDLKGCHVALARLSVAVKSSFHLRTSVSRKGTEIFRGTQREDDRFYKR